MLLGYLIAFALILIGEYLMWTTVGTGNLQHQIGIAFGMVGTFVGGWLMGRESRQ
ncbi:MAG: hypothetical protein WBQ33_02715 [Candidatus Binatus sp.]|jgi:hypothetical protein